MNSNPNLPRSAKRIEDTTYDRIWKFYFHKDTSIELSKEEETIRGRWDEAWKLRGSMLTKTEVANKLTKSFSISIRTAYLDISNADRMFGNPQSSNKAALRAILTDWAIKSARRAKKAKKEEVVEKLIGRIAKINGLEEKDDNMIADIIKKLKPNTIIFSADPETLKKQAEELMQGIDDTVDTDYEDIEED